jgi:hypothetical protein
MPLKIRDYVKEKFRIDMDPQNISNYKSALKGANKNARGRPPKAQPAAAATGEFSLEELQAVKKVADRIGAEKVRQLAEVLSK